MPAIYRNGTRYGNAPTSYPAENVAYDPTTSNLPATNAQNAIDELADATPRIASSGPASVVAFDTDTVAPFQEIKCEINAIQEGTPWIDSNVIEKEPYNFRKVAGTASRIGNHLFDKLVGGTVAFNQLVQNGNFESATGWTSGNTNVGTIAVNDNILTMSLIDTPPNNYQPFLRRDNISVFANHKYFVSSYINIPHATTIRIETQGGLGVGVSVSETNKFVNVSTIFTRTSDSINQVLNFYPQYASGVWSSGDAWQIKNVNLIDLTAMFGSTIADYIYSLEQATAGSGVNFFRKLFPKDYYAYNAGELMSVKTTAHKMVGKNMISDTFTSGLPSTTIGDDYDTITTTTRYAYLNLHSIDGNVTVSVRDYDANYVDWVALFCYVGKKLAEIKNCNTFEGQTFNLTGFTEVRMVVGAISGYNVPSAISTVGKIQLEIGSQATAYEPYIEHNYALDDVELRGLFKLDSNNKLYADGDTYESSGDVGRKYGYLLINGQNTLNYQPNGTTATTSNCYIPITGKANGQYNFMATRFVIATGTKTPYQMTGRAATNGIEFCLPADIPQTNADLQAWFSNNPIELIFELATPTTETADPFTNPQQVDANGTEEYVDNRAVAIPVGHETYYADIYDISGFTSCKVSVKDGSNVEQKSATISFGQTVYDGILEYKNGAWTFTGTHALLEKTIGDMNNAENYAGWKNAGIKALVGAGLNERFRNQKLNIGTEFSVNTVSTSDELYLDKTTYGLTQSQWKATCPDLIVQFRVPLATPFILTLAGAQLETLLGENRVSHNCNGDIEVKYYTSGVSVIKDIIDATPIDDLSNVSISSPTNNQILTYNSTSSKWENKALVVDSSLSSTSTNPVQNKVINTALSAKANTSDVNTALALKADKATTYTKTEVDDKFDEIDPIGSASGNPCNFETGIADALVSLKANILATGGGGTPSTPIPIVGISSLDITRCGKNFFNKTKTDVANGYVANSWLNDNNGIVPDADCNISEYIQVPANTIFTIKDTTYGNPSICFYDANKTFISGEKYNSRTEFAFTTPPNTAYLRFSIIKANIDTTQIELGSTATAYEPYNGQTFTIDLGGTRYGCYVDAVRGKLVVTHTNLSLDDIIWTYNPTYDIWVSNRGITDTISDHLLAETFPYAHIGLGDSPVQGSYINGQDNIWVRNGSTDTAPSGKAVYELATPIEIDVSELSVDTIIGVNNIMSDCGGDIEVEYLKNADMAEFVETIHNSLSPIVLTGTLNAGETSITFSSDAITEDSLIDIYTDPNIFYTGTTTSDGEVEITFPERQYNVSVKVRII